MIPAPKKPISNKEFESYFEIPHYASKAAKRATCYINICILCTKMNDDKLLKSCKAILESTCFVC